MHDPARPVNLCAPAGPSIEDPLSIFHDVSTEEVTDLLHAIDPSKATGSDEIPGILLKKCSTVLAPSLCRIFNASLSSGHVPTAYKVSHICPIFKSGNSTVAANYRPVSLLPIVSRLLEKVVQKQVVKYLTTKNLIPSSQFAYRTHHSTEDALVYAVDRWQRSKQERITTGIVLTDMSKAFGRVLQEKLIYHLSLGIDGTALKWFSNCLSATVQQVKHDSQLSLPVPCSRGVPQGSVLGPLLFTLYISNLNDILPPGVTHQEFADDVVLDCANKSPQVISKLLSTAVLHVSDWLKDLGVLLNSKKT